VTDLQPAADAVARAEAAVGRAAAVLAAAGDLDAHQVVAYDLAHAAAGTAAARTVLEYGGRGETEARIAAAFVADAVHDVASRMLGPRVRRARGDRGAHRGGVRRRRRARRRVAHARARGALRRRAR
jgi:hypothetical protein